MSVDTLDMASAGLLLSAGMQTEPLNRGRRRLLTWATALIGFIGTMLAAVPFIGSMLPSARAKARGGPIEVDVGRLAPGEQLTAEWRGQPVWVLRRTADMLESLGRTASLGLLSDPNSLVTAQQPRYAANDHRSLEPEYFVAIGLCTHLGCVPLFEPLPGRVAGDAQWLGGYFCPCHGSKFDLAGRVFKGVPAPTNLVVPPHRYLSETIIEIGVHSHDAPT